ncbi:MAG: hypothetical protein ACR2QH_17905 [Geminicoccaceae bacterium]
MLLLLIVLIAVVSVTLFVHASLEFSLLEHLMWWLTVVLGMIILGWESGLLAIAQEDQNLDRAMMIGHRFDARGGVGPDRWGLSPG